MSKFIFLDELKSKLARADWERLDLRYLEPLRREIDREHQRMIDEDKEERRKNESRYPK